MGLGDWICEGWVGVQKETCAPNNGFFDCWNIVPIPLDEGWTLRFESLRSRSIDSSYQSPDGNFPLLRRARATEPPFAPVALITRIVGRDMVLRIWYGEVDRGLECVWSNFKNNWKINVKSILHILYLTYCAVVRTLRRAPCRPSTTAAGIFR